MATQATAQGARGRGLKAATSRGAAKDALDALASAFEVEWLDRRALGQARRRMRHRAEELAQVERTGAGIGESMLLRAAGELIQMLRPQLVASPNQTRCVVDRIQEMTGLPRFALAREVLRAPELLRLPAGVAVETQLAMLMAFAPLRNVSIWTLDDNGRASCLRHAGGGPSRAAKPKARAMLLAEGPQSAEAPGLLLGVPVGPPSRPLAALVCSARPGAREVCASFLGEAVPVLVATLERDSLLAGNAASGRALVESGERKLTRLGLDLHDGPIQEVALLAGDMRLFAAHLDSVLESPAERRRVRARLQDLDAQLLALDAALRRISNEVRIGSALIGRPFEQALRDTVAAFAARTGLEPRLTLEGDLKTISGSQQIALLNILGEALNNAREHSEATEVRVDVTAGGRIEMRVSDNGRGFELEPTLLRAARRGRLGLVAMHERVRLLGGECRIDSRPGGPTIVFVGLEPWEPLEPPAGPAPATGRRRRR